MQPTQLTINYLFDRAEKYHRDKTVTTATATGIERVTYGEWADRTRRIASALDTLGITATGRVATFAWNTARHLELYFAAPCSGRVLHTLNIRLFPEQLTYIVNHAEDEIIFCDTSLWALLEHRSTYLHTMATMMTDSVGVGEADVILPVVPMFHANSWGLAHAGVASGADLVMPGPDLSGPAVARLIVDEKVTVAAGVPTIWMAVLPELKGKDTSSLRCIPCGGSAVPKALSEAYREQTGLPILQAWGMTETSPIAAVCTLSRADRALPQEQQADLRTTVGLIAFGVEMRVVEPGTTTPLPWDGESSGELQCSGPWIAADYYDDPRSRESFTDDGWLRTGDVAVVDPMGRIRLVDRTKDLIKSGGEWISSVDVENELMSHPRIAEAAVIGVPHPKWSERPLACVVVKPGESLTKEEVIEHLVPRLAKWQLPDDVVFIPEVPKTSVGKFSKKTLREQFADHALPDA
ncbi:MAG: fatty acid--CoA ligase [Actinobacteria bacterium]|nr:fatty acid--CoA ligase [Actinomycetota bacterium]